MAIEKVKLMHECFPKHLCMGTRMKGDEVSEEGKQKRAKIESKVGTKYRSSKGLAIARANRPPGLLLPDEVCK